MTDSNWLAVREVVLRGLIDGEALTNPPTNDIELGYLADTVTDHVVAIVEAPRDLKREARQRWRERRRSRP